MKNKINIFLGLVVLLLFTGAGCFTLGGKSIKTTGPSGMFLSQDRGETWNPIVAWPTVEGVKSIASVNVFRLVEDPQDNRALYLTSRENGLFFTFNDGQSWGHAEGPLSAGYVYSVAVHPKEKCIIYATDGSKVYRTDDCTRSWSEVYRESRSDTRVVSLAFTNTSPYKVFLAETNGDVLQSFDSSNSWSVVKRFKTRLVHIITHPSNPDLLYAISLNNGLYRSYDMGRTWVELKDKMGNFPGALDYRRYILDAKNPNKMYWVSTYGVLVTTDAGESWSAIDLITPPGSANIYGFAVNPNNDKEIYYTATINEKSTFYRSNDGGQNWVTKKLPSGQIPFVLRVHPDHPDWIYLGFTSPTQN